MLLKWCGVYSQSGFILKCLRKNGDSFDYHIVLLKERLKPYNSFAFHEEIYLYINFYNQRAKRDQLKERVPHRGIQIPVVMFGKSLSKLSWKKQGNIDITRIMHEGSLDVPEQICFPYGMFENCMTIDECSRFLLFREEEFDDYFDDMFL